MVLKFVQRIGPQDAAIIRDAIIKNKKFANLKDYNFLYKDFANFLKISGKEYSKIIELPAFIELGKHTFPTNGLTNTGDSLQYILNEKRKNTKDISIGFGEGSTSEALHLFLNDINEGEDIFSTLEIYDDFMVNDETEIIEATGLLLDIGSFFNNKILIYEKIHRFLIYNRKKYIKLLGEAFFDDIILLFSLPLKKLYIPKIEILENSTKKSLLLTKRKHINWENIGYCHFYSYGRGKGIDPWKYSGIFLELWINKKDQLVLTVSPADNKKGNIIDDYYKNNMDKKIFELFAKNNITDWINQYVATINFAEQLYTIIKTKILLSNV